MIYSHSQDGLICIDNSRILFMEHDIRPNIFIYFYLHLMDRPILNSRIYIDVYFMVQVSCGRVIKTWGF